MKKIIIPNDVLIRDLENKAFVTRWFAAEVIGTKRDLTNMQIKKMIQIMRKSDIGEVLVWGLGQMNKNRSIKYIGPMLENKNNYFKWRAAVALRDIANEEARITLERYLRKSKSPETRWRCAAVLGDIGSIKSFDALWKHLTDKDRFVRWKSVGALATLHGDVESLIRDKLMGKITPFLAWRSLWVLGQIGNSKTLKWIEKYLNMHFQANQYVQYQGYLAIETIKNRK